MSEPIRMVIETVLEIDPVDFFGDFPLEDAVQMVEHVFDEFDVGRGELKVTVNNQVSDKDWDKLIERGERARKDIGEHEV